MVAKVLVKRTSTPNSPPVTLDPGELAVEMDTPLRLWVGVPTNLDPTGKKLLVPLGGVVVAETPPVSPSPNTLWWESDTGILWLWYNDGTSNQWVQAAGAPAPPPIADIWVNTTGDTMTGDLNITNAGLVVNYSNQFYGAYFKNPAFPTSGLGLGLDANGTGWINIEESSKKIVFSVSTFPIANFGATGVVIVPPEAQNDYSLKAYASPAPLVGTAIIGYDSSATLYGISATYQGGGTYAFYGNAPAFLSSGTWGTSDAALKNVTGEFDRVSALAAVNAIAVKEFTPTSEHAKMMIYGPDVPGTLSGWIAQDVEPVLPLAVRDVGIPDIDLLGRAAIKGVSPPTKDTPAATALAAEDLKIKAINDHHMLTVLWAAVQQLSAEVEALKAGA